MQIPPLSLFIVIQIPAVHPLYTFFDVYFMMPAQCVQLTRVGEFAHGPIGFGSVEGQLSAITHNVDNQFGKPADSNFLTCADVDVAVADVLVSGLAGVFEVYVLHDEYAGIRHFLAPEEFAQRSSRTPKPDFFFADAVFGKYVQYLSVAVAAIDSFYRTQVHVTAYGIPVALLQAVGQVYLANHGREVRGCVPGRSCRWDRRGWWA